jgi:hypothetical protein
VQVQVQVAQVAVLLQPLMLAQAQVLTWEQEQEQEQASALETMAAPLQRASACLDHRPPEAQRPSDDQTLHRHPDQHPSNRT